MQALVVTLTLLCPAADAPSLAVMPLSPRQGVTPDTAALLTDHLVTALRDSRAFSRVVSMSELQTAAQAELQKQLVDCDSASCMAEIAGSLGADFIVGGNVGKLGTTWLISVQLIRARNGVASSSVTEPVKGDDEAALLAPMQAVVAKLVAQAGLGTDSPSAPPTPSTETRRFNPVLAVPGGVVLGLAALPALACAGGLVTALVAGGLIAALPDSGRYFSRLAPTALVGAGLGILNGVMVIGGIVVGGALIAAGVVTA